MDLLFKLVRRTKEQLGWFSSFIFAVITFGLAKGIVGIAGVPLAQDIRAAYYLLILWVVLPALLEEPIKFCVFRKLSLTSGIKVAFWFQLLESVNQNLNLRQPLHHSVILIITSMIILLQVTLFLIASIDDFSFKALLGCITIHFINNFIYYGLRGYWYLWIPGPTNFFESARQAAFIAPYFQALLYLLACYGFLKNKKKLGKIK